MNPTRLILTVALFLICIVAHGETKDPFRFSQIIGTLQFLERTDYDEKELGYSLRYENDKLLKADIYVYDNGLTHLTEGIASKEAQQEMESVTRGLHVMEEMGNYENVKELEKREKVIRPSGMKFLWARYSFRQIGGAELVFLGRRISDTYLLVRHGKFIKIRITTKESDLEEHEKEIERFVEQVAGCLE